MQKRRVELDILKGLAIFAVVIIHAGSSISVQAGSQTFAGQVLLIIDQLARFSVPLFVALSGYGLSQKYIHTDLDLGSFLQRRMKKIVPLYLFWSAVIYGTVHLISAWSAFGKEYTFIQALLWGKADYQLYFVPMILQLYLFFPLLRTVMNRVGGFWTSFVSIALQLTGFAIMNQWGWEDQLQYTWFISWIGYFSLGMWLSRLSLPVFLRRKRVAEVLLGGVLVSAIASFLHAKSLIDQSMNVIVATRFTRFSVFLFSSGSVLLLMLAKNWFEKLPNAVASFFSFVGKYSYLIFLSHTLALRWLTSSVYKDVGIEQLFVSGAVFLGAVWLSPKLATITG